MTSSRRPATSRSPWRRLDLADQASVASFVAGWDGPLHILVNNAGVMASPADAHARGLGAAVRHQPPRPLRPGHRPAPGAGRGRRGADRLGQLERAPALAGRLRRHPLPRTRAYEPWAAYGQSKTANVLFAVEATKRWADDGITTNALMPGGIRTNLQRYVSDEELDRMRAQAGGGAAPWKTPEQGAATSVLVADVAAARRRRRTVLRGRQRGRAEPAWHPARRRGLRARSRQRGAALAGLRRDTGLGAGRPAGADSVTAELSPGADAAGGRAGARDYPWTVREHAGRTLLASGWPGRNLRDRGRDRAGPATAASAPSAHQLDGLPRQRRGHRGSGAGHRVSTAARKWTSPTLDGQLYGEPLVWDGRVYVATRERHRVRAVGRHRRDGLDGARRHARARELAAVRRHRAHGGHHRHPGHRPGPRARSSRWPTSW